MDNDRCECPTVWGGTSRDPRPDPTRPDPECPEHGEHPTRVFAVVAIDETAHWTDAELVARCGGRLWTLYAYDPGAPMHCAELRASYELHPIGREPAVWVDDDTREAIDTAAAKAAELRYMHTSAVDAIAAELRELREFDDGDTIDDACEAFHANAPYLPGIDSPTTLPPGVEMWRERVRFSTCCDTPAPEGYATACEGQPCPTCEHPATFRYAEPRTDPEREMGVWFWYCLPGCLPDSDAFGPFETDAEAIAEAWRIHGEG